MESFEYKVLSLKQEMKSVLSVKMAWFDGDTALGASVSASMLSEYGASGWEVAGTIEDSGSTVQIILKRRLT